jgi:hypothetical protein
MKSSEFLEILKDDMLSHGLFSQYLNQFNQNAKPFEKLNLSDVLSELLKSEKIDIGNAVVTADHVEFVAWKGTIKERVDRSRKAVLNATGPDKEFAYWLCLRDNVDRFE